MLPYWARVEVCLCMSMEQIQCSCSVVLQKVKTNKTGIFQRKMFVWHQMHCSGYGASHVCLYLCGTIHVYMLRKSLLCNLDRLRAYIKYTSALL